MIHAETLLEYRHTIVVEHLYKMNINKRSWQETKQTSFKGMHAAQKIQFCFRYALRIGVTSEFSGVESDITSWNTENASSAVTPNDTFSPASGGNQYTCTVFETVW